MPAGRFRPAKPKRPRDVTTDHPTRETVTHQERRQIAHEARGGDKYRGVKAAAAAVGTASTRGARQVSRGAQNVVAKVNQEAALERSRHRSGLLGGIERGFGRMTGTYEGAGKALYHVGRAVAPSPHNLSKAYEFASTPGQHKYERTVDVTAGKSLSNLLFHGDTSHLPEAGLEAASLIPIGRGVKFGAEVALGARSAEDALRARAAEQAAKETASAAKAPAFGTKVAKGLGAHRVGRAAQDAAASAERAQRFGRAETEFGKAGGGAAGLRAAGSQMKGELPKIKVTALSDGKYALSQEDFDQAVNAIWEHPDLMTGQKLHAAYGLKDAFESGKALQPSQSLLLEKVFGPDEVKNVEKLVKNQHLVWQALAIPKTLMASFDVSAPLRQGLVGFARHPVIGAKGLPKMFGYLFSEGKYQALFDTIHADPDYAKAVDNGLDITQIGGDFGTREEPFISEGLLQHPKLNPKVGGQNINLISRGVHASDRAFTGYLDYMRFAMWKEHLRLMAKAGIDVNDKRELQSLSHFINVATGRGSLGPIESWAPAMNALFFSPRLMASRINIFADPFRYRKLSWYARKQTIRSLVNLGAATSATLAAGAYLLNGKVQLDPRSTDFAKLKMGNTRADVLGGFQQYIRVAAQLASGEKVDSQGNLKHLAPGGFSIGLDGFPIKWRGQKANFGQATDYDVATNFLQGKGNPTATLLLDALKGTAFGGQPLSVQHEVATRLVPLLAQDAWNIYKDKGKVQDALVGYGVGAFGIGLQNYPDAHIQKQQKAYKTWYAGVKKNLGFVPQELIRTYQARQVLDDMEAKRKGELGIVGFKSDDPKKDLELKREHAHLVIDALVKSYPGYEKDRKDLEALVDATPRLQLNNLIDRLRVFLDPSGEWAQYTKQANRAEQLRELGG